jgi:hypothetical protein
MPVGKNSRALSRQVQQSIVTPGQVTHSRTGRGIAPGPHGGFSPMDLPNPVSLFDATVLQGVANNGLVDFLPDVSGQGISYTAAGAFRPTFNTNVQNALSGLLFDGVGNGMATAVTSFRSYPHTLYAVVKSNVGDDGGLHWAYGILNGADFAMYADSQTQDKYGLQGAGGSVNSVIAPNQNCHILIGQANANADKGIFRIDGLETTGPLSYGNTAGFTFNIGSRGGSRFWSGHIFEGGLFAGTFSTPDFKRLERYASDKYGFSVA